jgi:hypothetical protein
MEFLEQTFIVEAWFFAAVVAGTLLVGGILGYLLGKQRSPRTSVSHGSEYGRTQERADSRREAEAGVTAREERAAHLNIRPLTGDEYERYSTSWRGVQARFVDDPPAATRDANRLVDDLMRTRGYRVDDVEQQAEDLAVNHPEVVDNYRSAHEIATRSERGDADTEELRRAFVHYRSLFDTLLETDNSTTGVSRDGQGNRRTEEAGYERTGRIRS